MRNLFLAAFSMAAIVTAAPAAAQFKSDRITVTSEGKGPDVVLIPGLTSSPRIWKATTAAVPGYRYHYVQVHGFAGTPAGGNATGAVIAPVADEIARYIRENKLARPAVIGHSLGGTFGMMIAARQPDAVGKLMVVDMVPWTGTFVAGPTATVEQVRPMAEKLRAAAAAKTPEQIRKERVGVIATMVKNETARAVPTEDSINSDPAVVANVFSELMLTDLRPELKAIKAPTTVLYVRPTTLPISDEQMDAFYKMSYADLSGVKLARVPDAWHFIMLDQPQRFQQDVKAFLQQ